MNSLDQIFIMPELLTLGVIFLILFSGSIITFRKINYWIFEYLHKKYPRIRRLDIVEHAHDMRNTVAFAFKALVAVTIMSLVIDMLHISVAWALWILLAWIILWNFPYAGLKYWEFQLRYGLISIVNKNAVDIFSKIYLYVKHKLFYALAVFLLLKFIVLPMYAPPESAPFLEEIALLAIAMHFVWHFPFVGIVGLWFFFPKEWPMRDNPDGRDLPAKVNFSLKNGKAHIKITNVLAPLSGAVRIMVVRGHNHWESFEFHVEPGKNFETTWDYTSRWLVYPVWYADLRVSFTGPEGLKGIRTFFPEKRGMSQRVLERVYSLPEIVKERIWL